MDPLEWLIVGGGVHGTHLSHVLVGRAGVAASRIRVLDPHELPLEDFWRMTGATGMHFLRSPSVHNLGLHAQGLRAFAKRAEAKKVAKFALPYDRPGLQLFRLHTESLVREHRLAELRMRCTAMNIARAGDLYRVETDQGVLASRRVVLALGNGGQLCTPEWAPEGCSPRIQHLFDPAFDRSGLGAERSVAIIGGGISAAQLACALSEEGCEVTIVARHHPRLHRFDSDPAWLGPKAMTRFVAARDPSARRRMIALARNRGSIPPEIHAVLKREMHRGRVRWVEAGVTSAAETAAGVALALDRSLGVVRASKVVLATGFLSRRPGGELLSAAAIDRLGLACGSCGYPLVSRQLEWAKGLYVSGPLAELELGPTARNIAGARAAAERLLAAA